MPFERGTPGGGSMTITCRLLGAALQVMERGSERLGLNVGIKDMMISS